MGLRYVRSRNRRVSRLINWVSTGGLVLGITLLIVVVAMHNGLLRTVEQDVFQSVPHAVVPHESGTAELIERLRDTNGIVKVERFVEIFALRNTDSSSDGVMVYAVESLRDYISQAQPNGLDSITDDTPMLALVRSVPRNWRTPSRYTLTFAVPTFQGVLSRSVAFRYGISNADSPPMYFYGPNVVVRIDDLIKTGVLQPNQVDWRITMSNPWLADELMQDVPGSRTWSQEFADYFRAVSIEKAILSVLLMFVVALASLNIVSGQAMLINSKKADIAILQTLGADPKIVQLAFAVHGLLIVVCGVAIGVVSGSLISHGIGGIVQFLAQLFEQSVELTAFAGIRPDLRVADVTITATVSLLIAGLGVVRPLSLVLRTNPIEALHSPT